MNRKRNVESIVNCLKEMIDRNGPSYLADEPYEIFRKLIEDGAADRQTAAVILYTLVSGVMESMESEGEPDILSEEIRRRCGLNKIMADQAANILHMLYSVEHEKEWERKN